MSYATIPLTATAKRLINKAHEADKRVMKRIREGCQQEGIDVAHDSATDAAAKLHAHMRDFPNDFRIEERA
jgi:hypothetical protein